jgi:hypothetical protein
MPVPESIAPKKKGKKNKKSFIEPLSEKNEEGEVSVAPLKKKKAKAKKQISEPGPGVITGSVGGVSIAGHGDVVVVG